MPRNLRRLNGPIGPPRGARLVTVADIPHLLEFEAVDKEVRWGTSGVIDWRGNRPPEQDLQSDDELRYVDEDGTAVTTAIARGTGDPAEITVAAAARPSATDSFLLVESEEEVTITPGTGVANLTWDERPEAVYRETGAQLHESDGTLVGAITWDDDGEEPDTVPSTVLDATDFFVYSYVREAVWIGRDGKIIWREGRPEERITGAKLLGGTAMEDRGVVTWNDAGDTVAAISNADAYFTQIGTAVHETTVLRVDGTIEWPNGERPSEALRLSNVHLFDIAGADHGLITWDDAGDSAAALSGSPRILYYTSRTRALVQTDGGIFWYGDRPDERYDGAWLYNRDPVEAVSAITWNDAGDTTTAAASNSPYHEIARYTGLSTSVAPTGTMTVGGDGLPLAKVGDRIGLLTLGQHFIITSRTDDNSFSVTADSGSSLPAADAQHNDTWIQNERRGVRYETYQLWRPGRSLPGYTLRFRGLQYPTEYRLSRPGKKFTGYQVRQLGTRIENWQLWSNGSYHGGSSDPSEPFEFFIEIADLGSDATPTVVFIDADGARHTWTPSEVGAVYKRAGLPLLVQEVLVGSGLTNITSFWAVFL